jgi:signal transduction histidine kinase
MASLFVIRGKNAGQHYSLRGPRTVLGRDASCDVQIADHEVSRQHAEVVVHPEGFVLIDLSSSNGCFLNGHRVSRQLIHSGDRLQIGRTLLVFNGQNKDGSTGKTSQQRSGQLGFGVDIVKSPPAAYQPSEPMALATGFDFGRNGETAPEASAYGSGKMPFSTAQPQASRSDNEELSQIRHVLGAPDFATYDAALDVDAEQPDASVARAGKTVSIHRDKSHWEIMYRTVLAVSRTLDLDQLLEQILDLIFQWVHCDRGCIMLMQEGAGTPRPAARKYRTEEKLGARFEISQTILDYVIRNREGVLTSNALDDTRWEPGASIAAAGIREAICVPMQGRYGIVGAIYIDTSRTVVDHASDGGTPMFDEEHLKMLVAIGHQAALAVEDTFYYRGMVQAERLAVMGQTIANLSHHVKNILQGLSGGSYLVDEGIKRQQIDVVAKGWRIVEKNQERIASMVMDMLTYSKDRQPVLAATDLRVTVDDCYELCVSRAKDLEVGLKWDRPESFPSVMADSEAMHRAILNVLHNAIDAVADIPGGQVDVSLTFSTEWVAVEIRDNGVGIPAEDLQRIFSVFESSKGSRGTGLGLPVSQKILREHGGDIEVTSQIGQGSCFRLAIPNRTPSAETQSLQQQPTLF